jgi:predicted nucleotidyltransferase
MTEGEKRDSRLRGNDGRRRGFVFSVIPAKAGIHLGKKGSNMHKQEIINKIRLVLERHRYVVKAELFGSLVRGDDKPDSDVDLLVLYDENRPKGLDSFAIFEDLEEMLGRKVDIVQEKLLYDFVKENIQEDKELIYERQ